MERITWRAVGKETPKDMDKELESITGLLHEGNSLLLKALNEVAGRIPESNFRELSEATRTVMVMGGELVSARFASPVLQKVPAIPKGKQKVGVWSFV